MTWCVVVLKYEEKIKLSNNKFELIKHIIQNLKWSKVLWLDVISSLCGKNLLSDLRP